MQPGSNSAYSHEETDADRKRSILTENALSLDLVFAFSGDRELTESENTRCIFRDDLASDFGMSRPPISVSSGH